MKWGISTTFCLKKWYFHCIREKLMDWSTKSSFFPGYGYFHIRKRLHFNRIAHLFPQGFFIYLFFNIRWFFNGSIYWKITGWNPLISNGNGISTSFCEKKWCFHCPREKIMNWGTNVVEITQKDAPLHPLKYANFLYNTYIYYMSV